MRLQSRLVVLLMASLVIVGPALAEKGDRTLRFGIQNSSPTGDILSILGSFEAEPATGPVVSFEFMVTDLLGIEPSLRWTNHDVEQDSETIGDFDMIPLMVNANFHVVRKEKVGLYLGPQIGYILYQDLQQAGGPGEASLEDGFTFGAIVGVDVPIKKGNWLFNASLSLISTDAEFKNPGSVAEIEIDPVVLRLGAGRRF